MRPGIGRGRLRSVAATRNGARPRVPRAGVIAVAALASALIGGATASTPRAGIASPAADGWLDAHLVRRAMDVTLAVCDLDAARRFYGEGLGLQLAAEPATRDGVTRVAYLFAGSAVELRTVPDPPTGRACGATANGIADLLRRILGQRGYRFLYLRTADAQGIAERLAALGIPAWQSQPGPAGELMTLDPDGTVVSVRAIQRDAEHLELGVTVSDDRSFQAFYADAVGLTFERSVELALAGGTTWEHRYRAGDSVVKFWQVPAAYPTPAPADDTYGVRYASLYVRDVAAVRRLVQGNGGVVTTLPGGERLRVTDPDGNHLVLAGSALEGALFLPLCLDRAEPDTAIPTAATPVGTPSEPTARTPTRTPTRVPTTGATSTATRPTTPRPTPTAVAGALFERVAVAGVSDWYEGTNGLAIADFDRDGRLDIVTANEARKPDGGRRGADRLRLHLNRGGLRFETHPIRIAGAGFTAENMGDNAQVPNVVDFNGDGFLDILITRHRGGPRVRALGNTLLLSQGAFDRFAAAPSALDLRNLTAYNRQTSIGDVNGDGWLDVAVGADNIGHPDFAGEPVQRLYVYRPDGARFEDGAFEDVGGTDLVPDFGGAWTGNPERDRGGPDIALRDLDDDGDLDLIQGYHNDMMTVGVHGMDPAEPGCSGPSTFGVFTWRNLLAETGSLRFERVTGNGLAEAGRMRWNGTCYEVVEHAAGLPYISLADADNDGRLDVVAVGPSDPTWHVNSDAIAGRFWRNLGNFRFDEATDSAGLEALNWSYLQWHAFWGFQTHANQFRRPSSQLVCGDIQRYVDHQFYAADAVWGDFDNDGWQDLVLVDRRERGFAPTDVRAVLFMNDGDGTFHPTTTPWSGLEGHGIAGEAADLDDDGLLDLVLLADPENSGGGAGTPLPPDAYGDVVYRNTGGHGARENHWLRLRFAGLPDRRLVGARVYAYPAGTGGEPGAGPLAARTVFSDHTYKSGGALEVHFGLGARTAVDIRVLLPDGTQRRFAGVGADRSVTLDLGGA